MNSEIVYREITDLDLPGLDAYARLSENELRHYYEPHGGLFVAESAMVIERALDAGYEPVSVLAEHKVAREQAAGLLARLAGTKLTEAGIPLSCGRTIVELPGEQAVKESAGLAGQTVRQSEDTGFDGMTHREGRSVGESACGHDALPVYTASAELLDRLTGYHLTRGLLCLMRRKPLPDAAELCNGMHRVAVLERVMNPTNLGAIFRSAAALRMEAVLLTPGCTDPLYRRAARVSMGTVFQIPWTYLPEDWISLLHGLDFRLAAFALSEDTVDINDPALNAEERLAVVLGSEGPGLMPETVRAADYAIRIPMSHGVDSLNVAAASAVAFWQLGRHEAGMPHG